MRMTRPMFLVLLCAAMLSLADCARAGTRRQSDVAQARPQSEPAERRSRSETPPGLNLYQMQYGGMSRSYYIHLPAGYDKSRQYPAVFVFHGGEGNGASVERMTNMARLADRHGFVAMYPNGETHWNDGRETLAAQADDVGFAVAMTDQLAERWNVDKRRIFVTGVSNGGMFVQRLACEASERFAAFASVVANLPSAELPRCKPSRALPILMINGTADRLMPWSGGEIPSFPLLGLGQGGHIVSTPRTVEFWRDANRCASRPQIVQLPDRANDGTRIARHSYTGCTSGAVTTQHHWHYQPGHGCQRDDNRLLSGAWPLARVYLRSRAMSAVGRQRSHRTGGGQWVPMRFGDRSPFRG